MVSRASIKGRGVEILFGEAERALDEEALAAEMETVEAPGPEATAVSQPPEAEKPPEEAKPAPEEAEKPPSVPPEREIEEALEYRELIERIGIRRFRKLVNEIEELYDIITDEISPNKETTDEALELLRQARETLLSDTPDYDEAEHKVNQVKALIERTRKYREWGAVYGTRLLIYEVVIGACLLGLLMFDKGLTSLLVSLKLVPSGTTHMSQVFPMWNTTIWGGIGGIVGALYSLYWHVAVVQDFNRYYSMYYIVQPIMGIILGGIIHLIFSAGFLAMGADITALTEENIRWLPSLVACLAGFRQKFAYEMLDKLMQLLGREPSTS